MSNHEIGHAMSLLGEDILELYEAGKISKEACKSIIRSYIDVAGNYDGNHYEAVESVVEAGYCGLCFEKFEELGVFSAITKTSIPSTRARSTDISISGILCGRWIFCCTLTSARSARQS
ncbi:MAG: hypothetical protein VZR11_08160 [Succinimonas sp.]|nr:hypothetical protein [Succinimonas sp.]